MRTNIVIDDQLMRAAMKAGRFRTKRAAVEAGLQLLSQVRAQAGFRRLRGKIRWQGDLAAMRASRLVPEPAAWSSWIARSGSTI